jgi:hypothetical protein
LGQEAVLFHPQSGAFPKIPSHGNFYELEFSWHSAHPIKLLQCLADSKIYFCTHKAPIPARRRPRPKTVTRRVTERNPAPTRE